MCPASDRAVVQGVARAIGRLADRVRAQETNYRSEIAGGHKALLFVNLPAAGQAGRVVFVTNGRKVGQGPGAGTGVLAYDDGAAWRRPSDDSVVAA